MQILPLQHVHFDACKSHSLLNFDQNVTDDDDLILLHIYTHS